MLRFNSYVMISRFVRSLAESEAETYQWLPVSFIILPKQVRSKSESRKKFSTKYSDERDELVAFANSCEGKVWIAKSSSGAKGDSRMWLQDICHFYMPHKRIVFFFCKIIINTYWLTEKWLACIVYLSCLVNICHFSLFGGICDFVHNVL